MNRILTITICFCFSVASFSQPLPKTQAELNIFLKEMQKKADSMQKAIKNRSVDPKSISSVNNSKTNSFGKEPNGPGLIPQKDSVRIKSIPTKNFTPAELSSYIKDLHTMLTKKLPADLVNSANKIASDLGNDPLKLESAALFGMQNGSKEEALLLITKASSQTSDGLTLTNAGALLDMNGLSEKAIPILRTVVRYNPEDALALNNLGQAYTSLGMQDSALYYFSRCLSFSPQHPEANNTAGAIELQKGNKARAQAYFENSLRGGFNISAYTGLKAILKDKCRITELVKPKVKFPEYFNQFKYKLPRQCLNVYEAATVSAEFKAYKEMLNNELRKFDNLKKEAENQMGNKWAEDVTVKAWENAASGKNYLRPYQILGGIMEGEAMVGYGNDIADLQKFNKENREQFKQLQEGYKAAYEQMMRSGSSSCAKENELKNKWLARFAQVNEEWQSRNMLIENKYIDDLLFWCYFSAFDKNDYRNQFYHCAYNYLYKLNWLAQIETLEPCEKIAAEKVEKPEAKELKEMDCPAKLSIPFGVGKLEVDCQKFSFKAGEAILFRIEHNYITKQCTWSLGAGAELYDGPGTIGGKEIGGLDVKIHMSAFITLDQYGNVSDAGLVSEAKAGVKYGFEGSTKLKLKEEVGWRLGYNTGLSLNEGRLKDLIDKNLGLKPDVQQNKNIKIYKPNN